MPRTQKTFTAAELDQVAVPPPFKRKKAIVSSLVPHPSKWECFECGKVICAKKICPYCGHHS